MSADNSAVPATVVGLLGPDTADGEAKFGIVITARARHGDLWKAAMRAGSTSALARLLGLPVGTVARWVNLKGAPSLRWLEETEVGQKVRGLLETECAKTVAELWPQELRAAIAQGDIGRQIAREHEVSFALLAHQAEQRLTLPSPADSMEEAEFKEALSSGLDKALRTLGPRERKALELKHGINQRDGRSLTLRQVGEKMGISPDRVRQILNRAERKLRHPQRAKPLYGLLQDALHLESCPNCRALTAHFIPCIGCSKTVCPLCVRGDRSCSTCAQNRVQPEPEGR